MERFFFQTAVEHEQAENSPGTLVGYVTKWNTLSHDRGGYRDVFRPGTFGDSVHGVDGVDVKAYRDHDETIYLGRTGNGSLTLSTDSVGLRFALSLPDTTHGRDTAALVSRGDLAGMSFGYLPDEFRWKQETQGVIREHLRGRLVEVSVVFSPAFPHTEVELSSVGEPSEAVLASLHEWEQEQRATPRRNRAARLLQIVERNLLGPA